jgi:L-ascorbate metabolism protein UlaG (beta-lactamase superfamily)
VNKPEEDLGIDLGSNQIILDQPAHLTYIGHATTLIEMDGLRIMTDPILRSRVLHLSRSKKQIEREWLQNIDIVLISHAHWDHLDIPSLRMIRGDPLIIVPPGVGNIVAKGGFERVVVLEVSGQYDLDGLRIIATYADHDGRRFRFFGDAKAVGYVINGSYKFYFAGDTDLYPEMADMRGELDVALLPVWGWGPTVGGGHMNPRQAAKATGILQPRIAIPIHWGTLFPIGLRLLMPDYLRFPPREFKRETAKSAPDVDVIILPSGSTLDIDKTISG